MNIEYTVQIWQEGDQYVAHALPLDVISSGDTLEKARMALQEAVELFIEIADKMNTISDVLQDVGYEYRQGNWVSPSWVSIERHTTFVE
jgi:predicted RNase H-like HicB family nuclease